ncbi:MAG: 16S rRNA (adenine(1518)-N(6)/adenine(1519)-N(6))-dimethyltransferase RsmA [bacterium]|nr:16S rRNA (adenine(1518)-N(6)/adenine(1519)-N(6))-dimethyltransferase RsmA [bacterium]
MPNFKSKKSLGQNFLINEKIYHFMVGEIAPEKGEIILEVGPGEGILADLLTKKEAKVLAVEKDSRLIPSLKKKNFEVIEGDILKFNPKKYKLKEGKYKIVGNIPYYITSHLLRITLEDWPRPKLILFMVQKEVARRITANPPKMSLLALAIQFYAEAKIVKNVSKNNFRPVPKVDSALIKILPKENIPYSKEFQKNFFKLARAGFGNKRKQILNSLVNNLKLGTEGVASRPYGAGKTFIIQKLAEAKIEPSRRSESLNIEEWVKLTQLLFPEPPSA